MNKINPAQGEQAQGEQMNNNSNFEVSSHIVIYDSEEDFGDKCRICFKQGHHLVNPCRCNYQYHQSCILEYIRRRLKAMGNQVDLSKIKCRHCHDQIRFLSHQNTQCGCKYFKAKMRKNWCSKTLAIILFFIVAIVAIAIVMTQLIDPQTIAYLILMVIEGLLSIVCLSLIFVFMHYNFIYREIVLVKVYQFHQVMHPTHSSSDDENQIAHQNIQIIINQNY